MATSGSIENKFTAYDTLVLSWERTSYSIASNSSTIKWTLKLVSGSAGRISSSVEKDWQVTINGASYTGTALIGIANNATKTLASGSTVISHKSDGTKSFGYSFNVGVYITFNDVYIKEVTASGTGTLNTIPRATTPTLSASSTYMGNTVTITTDGASPDFTHDLAYRLSEGDYISIATGVVGSHDWTVPDLAEHLPNSPSGNLTIRCITKSGGTQIGEPTYIRLVAKVPLAYVPYVTNLTVTDGAADIASRFGIYIQGKSSLKVQFTPVGNHGSTIKDQTVTLSTGYSTSSTSFTSPTLEAAGEVEITINLKDSRDRTSITKRTVAVEPYTLPEVSAFEVYRRNAAGEAAPDGELLAIRYDYKVPLYNGGNTAQVSVRYKRTTEEQYGEPVLTRTALSESGTFNISGLTLSADYSYDFKISVVDYFGAEAIATARLPSAEVILDVKADGDGFAVGGVAELPGFSVHWPMRNTRGREDQVLLANTDLNSLLAPNYYGGKAWPGYANCPVADRDFALEVLLAGPEGQLMQRLTTRVPLAPVTYTRYYEGEAWTPWFISGFETIWQGATLSSKFALYDSSVGVQYRRSGGVVEIKGAIKPASSIAYNDGWVTITTLPEGYRPGGMSEVNRICQGGGNCIWLARVTLSGEVQFARYRDGSTATTAGTDARLPFSIIFLADR